MTPLGFALASIIWGLVAFEVGWMTVVILARGVNRGDWRS